MFLAHIGPFFSILGQKKKFFSENPALSRTTSYEFLAPCQISEKTNDTIPRKCLDRRTEGRTDTILKDPSGYRRGCKNPVFGPFWSYFPNFGTKKVFPENPALPYTT